MNLLSFVIENLADFHNVRDIAGDVLVNSQCIYPSNSIVRVTIRGGGATCVVSDEWGAYNEICDAGGDGEKARKVIESQARRHGLKSSKGNIHTPQLDIRDVTAAIALVANASSDVARYLFSAVKPARRDFKYTLRDFLYKKFNGAVKHDINLLGFSNKVHKFENAIVLGGEKMLIVDPVSVDRASVNSRLVAHLDIQRKNISGIQQRIVYDDEADWAGEDLNLLTIGAPVVAFSKADRVIGRMVKDLH